MQILIPILIIAAVAAVIAGFSWVLARFKGLRLGLFYLVLILGAASMIIPFLWMVLTSLKPEDQIFAKSSPIIPRWETAMIDGKPRDVRTLTDDAGKHTVALMDTSAGLLSFRELDPATGAARGVIVVSKGKEKLSPGPVRWMWSNYPKALDSAPFGRYFINTTIYAVFRVIFNLLLCSMAAYAFARLSFPGKNVFFWAVLATMMIPGQITMIPVFLVLKHMPFAGGNDLLGNGGHGWLNTYWGLIIPGAVGAFGIFLLRQFFSTLPTELEDAARMDGCTEFGIYSRVVLPLSKPVLATLGIFTFTAAWNDFLWPLLVMSKDSMKTLQIGLQVFQSQYATQWDLLMAATVVITLPILVVFLICQRYFTQGIALSGMKG